jgi:Enoyl-CoA hydratase/isomerase
MVEAVRVDREGQPGVVARVTIARPEVHNAFDASTIRDLTQAFRRLATEPSDTLRVVVLAGDGPSFSAGADLTWMRASLELDREANEQDAMKLAEMLDAIDTCPMQVIARVHGAAIPETKFGVFRIYSATAQGRSPAASGSPSHRRRPGRCGRCGRTSRTGGSSRRCCRSRACR